MQNPNRFWSIRNPSKLGKDIEQNIIYEKNLILPIEIKYVHYVKRVFTHARLYRYIVTLAKVDFIFGRNISISVFCKV